MRSNIQFSTTFCCLLFFCPFVPVLNAYHQHLLPLAVLSETHLLSLDPKDHLRHKYLTVRVHR